jgi:hypothetical protein
MIDILRVKDVTYVTFEVLTVVLMKAHYFWYVVPVSVLEEHAACTFRVWQLK